jgi:hypothetical protein
MSLGVQADEAEIARSCLDWATNGCGQASGDTTEARGYVAHCVASIAARDVLIVTWRRFPNPSDGEGLTILPSLWNCRAMQERSTSSAQARVADLT